MTRREILEKAITTYGIESQCLMAIEEMAELTKALLKYFRYGPEALHGVLEEIADARIMLDQMTMIFDNGPGTEFDLERVDRDKIARLHERINKFRG